MIIAKKLLAWYHLNKRDLPWRVNKNPYKVWLSEIILQQTRVKQGLPYYNRFVSKYPEVQQLAEAPLDEVLKLWEGLGYYSRARNLHFAANQIVTEFNGSFPNNYADLLRIKGIGPYTAAAIASICFNQQTAVVDGNVFRVLSRVFGIDTPINSTEGKKIFATKAAELINDTALPGDFNQAIMEFGALQCTPKNPNCPKCPLRDDCIAFSVGKTQQWPIKMPAKPKKKRFLNYFILLENNKIAVQQRTEGDIWAGLYEFCLVETHSEVFDMQSKYFRNAVLLADPIHHKLTHQHLTIRFWKKEVPEHLTFCKANWVSINQLHKLPWPIALKRFISSNPLFLPR